MRVLVLGASGMLGHRVARHLGEAHDVAATLRRPDSVVERALPGVRLIEGVDAVAFETVGRVIDEYRPDAVVNCIGIVKQKDEAKAAIPSIQVNALFPHLLAQACEGAGTRMVHISTDCVFSGARGHYRESDTPDATDLYGRTKLLGEVCGSGVVTVRTSIIGWELKDPTGLLEWFATKRGGACLGYRRAVFSGLSTAGLSRVIESLLTVNRSLEGLWHVSEEPVNKFDLLRLVNEATGWAVQIAPVDEPVLDRSLDSTRFRQATGWKPAPWSRVVEELAAERAWYDALRSG